MSDKVSTEAEVSSVNSTREGTEVTFKNTSGRIFGLLRNKFKILFDENPGWNEGEEVRVSAEKIGGGTG